MVNGYKVNIENNSNNGNITVQVYYQNSLIEHDLYKEFSGLNQEQKEMVLNFIKKFIKNK